MFAVEDAMLPKARWREEKAGRPTETAWEARPIYDAASPCTFTTWTVASPPIRRRYLHPSLRSTPPRLVHNASSSGQDGLPRRGPGGSRWGGANVGIRNTGAFRFGTPLLALRPATLYPALTPPHPRTTLR